jgi:gliding motility-associated-like protein
LNKGILLLSYFFLCSFLVSGQTTYIKSIGGAGEDIANSAIETNDGNYLVIGSTSSFGSGGSDGYIAKLNGAAKEIWDRAVGGSNDEAFLNGIQLSDGNFLLVGWTTSFGNGGKDMMVTKVDNFGNIMWTRTFGGSNDERAFSAIETSDGNFIIAGHTESFGAGNLDVLVIKTDQDGNEVWSKTYGTTGNDWFNGHGLIEDNLGNYILTGAWYRGNGLNPHDGFFMKIDPNGDVVTLRGYGGNGDDGLNGHLREFGNGYQNIGITWSFNGPNHEIWMSDFDLNGDLNWSKTFGLPGENIRIGLAQYTNDGNYLVSGYDFTEHTNAKGKALLLKVTPSGEVLWSKMYGDSGIETLDVVFETDNGVIAFGKTTSYGEGGNDIFIVRTDEFGTVSGCSENVNLIITNVNPDFNSPNFSIDNLSLGETHVLSISNIANVENVICDGCDATDLEAGLFCETAPIICSIDCLDGFTATLPDVLIMPQPEPLCDGGIPNNVSWFAFVAGSNTVNLSIIPTNCTTIFDDTGTSAQTIGIQAGVYEGCDFENSFICMTDGCLDLVAETINISSNQFEIGNIYYLFVDGCGGSICDYEVVVNSAEQAFAMPELTTISNDLDLNLEEDTLCVGTTIIFSLDDFDLDVEFNWAIDPPTSDYPTGVHPVFDTSAVTFVFSEEGCFDIHVYAFNDCDNSETVTFNVCVETLEDEMFSDIYVCQECFPITLISPESGCIITEGGGTPTVLIEDPNGDGVPGWLGTSTIVGPGLDSNIVTNTFGCTYVQYVNVLEIPLSPREQIDYYFCLTDFPVNINGSVFNNPGDTRNITLQGEAASGCDSLISITAHGIDLFGVSNIGNCEAGEVELSFVLSSVVPETYDSITYIWYDENGDVVSDSDNIDSILIVTGVGSFSVQIAVHVDGVSCAQTYGPFMVDIDNLAPNLPNITYAPIEICLSELQAQIYVGNQGLSENYLWTINPNLPFSFGLTSDTIYIDISSGQDFEFCVYAENGCGSSNEFCDNVIVNESPDSEFSSSSEICMDSFVTVQYTGAFGNASSSIFNWDFGGGNILNGMDPNSGGPFEIGFSGAGNYIIGLFLVEAGCSSILTQQMVSVVAPFDAPMIDCQSDSGEVTFTWDDTGVENVSVNLLSGQSSFELIGNTYIVSGLSSEEEVTIQIVFNSESVCGGTIVSENCASLPCPDVLFDINLSEQNICMEDGFDVDLEIIIVGDNSGQGTWNSPFVINNNQFDINSAGIGAHPISYSYIIDDCTYNVDTIISIFDLPSVDVDIFPSYCEEMGSNMINILTSLENTVLLDGMAVNELNNVEVTLGEHTLDVLNLEGCSVTYNFNIENHSLEDLVIFGENKIIQGESGSYTAEYNSDLEDLILIWTLDGDTICVDCNEVTITPTSDSELCVSINFGEECSEEHCLLIEISQKTKLHIPNIFSPNNDNINDFFNINSNSSDVFIIQIMIFDRWGEMVYNQKGLNVGEESRFWDGTFNGRMCETGVYVYIIEYLDEENKEKKIFGDLTLVK